MEKKKKITPEYIMKCEVAKEIGLWDKIEKLGWKSLTSRESGRLGGEIAKRKRKKEEKYKNWQTYKRLAYNYFIILQQHFCSLSA